MTPCLDISDALCPRCWLSLALKEATLCRGAETGASAGGLSCSMFGLRRPHRLCECFEPAKT